MNFKGVALAEALATLLDRRADLAIAVAVASAGGVNDIGRARAAYDASRSEFNRAFAHVTATKGL